MENREINLILLFFLVFFATIDVILFLEATDAESFQGKFLPTRLSPEEKQIEEKQIEELPPAENVLLATAYRTGSSFLAEIFNQNDEILYLFEPDHNLFTKKNGHYIITEQQWVSFILDLFQCKFTNPYLIQRPEGDKIIFEERDRLLAEKFCDRQRHCRPIRINEVEDLCRRKKRVIKTIKVANIDVLLKEAERRKIDLRVLLFFRDSRPVFLSRKKAGALINYYSNINRFCTEKLEQHAFYEENFHLRSRLMSLKFEEFALHPIKNANDVYDFLKWNCPPNIHGWIQKNTAGSLGPAKEYGTSRNSSEIVSQWKDQISKEEKFLVDLVCKDYLNALKYN